MCPQVPTSSTLAQVLPYLLRLAVSDPQLYWRLGVALAMMVVSKSAGVQGLRAVGRRV